MRSLIRLFKNRDAFNIAKNHRIPVFLTDRYRPCFNSDQGDCDARVIVVSIPKSGTYMVGALLRALNFVETEIHIHAGGSTYADFRFVPLSDQKNVVPFIRHLRLKETLCFILPGQYALSHLNYNDQHDQLTRNDKRIFVYRDIRDNLVSYLKWYFVSDKQTEHRYEWEAEQDERVRFLKFLKYEGPDIIKQFNKIAEWMNRDNVFMFQYEAFVGDHGEERADALVTALIDYLGCIGAYDTTAIRQFVLNEQTRTKSDARSNWQDVWSDDVEAVFRELGFDQLNRRLGYRDN